MHQTLHSISCLPRKYGSKRMTYIVEVSGNTILVFTMVEASLQISS